MSARLDFSLLLPQEHGTTSVSESMDDTELMGEDDRVIDAYEMSF